MNLLVFQLESQKFALDVTVVDRVMPSVRITALPGAPSIIPGVIVLQGITVPVFNIRNRFGFTDREITVTDRMIVANSGKIKVVLSVDSVWGVHEQGRELPVSTNKLFPSLRNVKGVQQLDDGLVIIQDLEKFLSMEEVLQLNEALKNKSNNG